MANNATTVLNAHPIMSKLEEEKIETLLSYKLIIIIGRNILKTYLNTAHGCLINDAPWTSLYVDADFQPCVEAFALDKQLGRFLVMNLKYYKVI